MEQRQQHRQPEMSNNSAVSVGMRQQLMLLLVLASVVTATNAFVVAAAAATAPAHSRHQASPTLTLSLADNNEGNNDSDEAEAGDAYHLLWSKGHWNKFLYTTAALFVVPNIVARLSGVSLDSVFLSSSSSGGTAAASCHTPASRLAGLWNNLVLPLFASSCCLLQLALNALALGCAGWNKKLGPFRPYLLAWLLVASLRRPLPSPLTLTGRAAVALLPEALDWYNNNNHLFYRKAAVAVVQQEEGGGGTNGAAGPSSMVVPAPTYEVTMDVPGMGCTGCVHAVNDALHKVTGVTSAKSHLYPMGGGSATVLYQGEPASSAFLHETLIGAITDAGFDGATVTTSERQEPPPKTTTTAAAEPN